MTYKFKVGDVVTCIDDGGYATLINKGNDYVVKEYIIDSKQMDCIAVKSDEDIETGYVRPFAKRFVLSKRHIWNEQMKELINECKN